MPACHGGCAVRVSGAEHVSARASTDGQAAAEPSLAQVAAVGAGPGEGGTGAEAAGYVWGPGLGGGWVGALGWAGVGEVGLEVRGR